MGGPKFAHTAGVYGLRLDEHTAQHLVWDWRAANTAIVQLWRDLGEAFQRAVHAPTGTWERLGQLQVGKTGKAVRVRLPSGRDLVYQAADVGQDEKGRPELGYWGVCGLTNRWKRLRTYGGKLVENLVQATARDALSEAILRCEAQGLRTVLTVHDEGIFESPEERAFADLQKALTVFRTPPAWADGLPVGAEGWVGPRYRK
jgi:DNA polymerase